MDYPQIVGVAADATVRWGGVTEAEFVTMPGLIADCRAFEHRPGALYCMKGDPAEVASWVETFTSPAISSPTSALKLFTADHRRFGAAVFHDATNEGDVVLTVASTPGVWNRAAIRALAHLAFVTLDYRRVSLRIRANDMRARDYARRLGFRPEGITRQGFASGEDCFVWGMLRSECKWIRNDLNGR